MGPACAPHPRTPPPPPVIPQAAGAKPFSLSVSTAVLRLYALQPTAARREIIAKILLAALAQLPANDYKTCIYLVPERLQVRSAHGSAAARAERWATPRTARRCGPASSGWGVALRPAHMHGPCGHATRPSARRRSRCPRSCCWRGTWRRGAWQTFGRSPPAAASSRRWVRAQGRGQGGPAAAAGWCSCPQPGYLRFQAAVGAARSGSTSSDQHSRSEAVARRRRAAAPRPRPPLPHPPPSVPGFLDAARRFVAHTLSITFVRITKREAADALRLEARELDAYLAERVRGRAAMRPSPRDSRQPGASPAAAPAGHRDDRAWPRRAASPPCPGHRLQGTRDSCLHPTCTAPSQAQRDGWGVTGDVVVLPRNAHNTPAQRQAAELVPLDSVAPALAGAA